MSNSMTFSKPFMRGMMSMNIKKILITNYRISIVNILTGTTCIHLTMVLITIIPLPQINITTLKLSLIISMIRGQI